ncbi:MAG: hypothetical protein ABL995_06265 [Bryobacteraceae bacterium]
MTYIKLLSESRKQHLVDEARLKEGTTLCGSTFVRVQGWKRIDHLEGDECARCAANAFSHSSRVRASPQTEPFLQA